MTTVVEITHGLGLGGAEVALVDRLAWAPGGTRTVVLNTLPRLSRIADEVRAVAEVRDVALLTPGGSLRLLRELRRLDPDVVVLHSPTVVVVVLLLRLLRGFRAPVVVVAHNEAARPVFRHLLPLVNPLADLHVAVSKRVRDAVQCRRARMVAVEYLGAGAPAASAPTDGGVRFLWLARMAPQKRLDVFLEAVALVAEELRANGASVAVAGDGPEREAAERFVDGAGLRDVVRFLGQVRPSAPLLAASDVLVVSSDYEGLPISVFEALLAGQVVVATDVGGIAEVVDEAAGHRLVPVEPVSVRVDELARAMAGLAEDAAAVHAGRSSRAAHAARWRTEERAASYYATLARLRLRAGDGGSDAWAA